MKLEKIVEKQSIYYISLSIFLFLFGILMREVWFLFFIPSFIVFILSFKQIKKDWKEIGGSIFRIIVIAFLIVIIGTSYCESRISEHIDLIKYELNKSTNITIEGVKLGMPIEQQEKQFLEIENDIDKRIKLIETYSKWDILADKEWLDFQIYFMKIEIKGQRYLFDKTVAERLKYIEWKKNSGT